MLVLSRKAGEGIAIAQDIEVDVISVSGQTVRLGFKAPRDVSIVRKEIINAKRTALVASLTQSLDPTLRVG
jgi:carbon storage regulator